MIKLDLHLHSYYSFDCLNKPDDIAKQIKKLGLDGFSITDHNVFKVDFKKLQEAYPELIIIPGTEIWTEIGDILIYFLTDSIESHDAKTVIEEAHDQGGIAVLAHPYYRFEGEYPSEIIESLDGIETSNAQNCHNRDQSVILAQRYQKPEFGGSDGHFICELGGGYTEVDFIEERPFDLQKLKKAMSSSTTSTCKSGPKWHFLVSQGIRYAKKLNSFNFSSIKS